MKNTINNTIDDLINELQNSQKSDGSWRFCFESGPMSDAYMIILMRSLKDPDEKLINLLVNRLLSVQSQDGTWKLFHDESKGNLSATIEAYFALVYSGYVDEEGDKMIKARSFIINSGGLINAHELTKVMLSLTGQIKWPVKMQLPIEFLLLPRSSPISLFDFVGYARVHIVPILIASNYNYFIRHDDTPDLSDLLIRYEREDDSAELSRSLLKSIKSEINKIIELPKNLRKRAFEKGKDFMLARLEPDGTLYSYFSSTFFMVFALLALGYSKNDPVIISSIKSMKTLICKTRQGYHIQNPTSTLWDTALISHALQLAGVNSRDPGILKAADYIKSRQQFTYGDWVLNNPSAIPGGWGFSDINTLQPDVDDTTAALRAIKGLTSGDSWARGLAWVLSMQNGDGGWAAFEKNRDNYILTLLPVPEAGRVFIDPSTADLTGRTLEFLGKYANLDSNYPEVKRAVYWLIKNQEKNGSWYGRWGISYIYGTWAAISGLRAAGIRKSNRAVVRGAAWLRSVQNEDGGWGESCFSDIQKKYVPLDASTPSQTAWALDALIAVDNKPTHTINKGVEQLVHSVHKTDWTTDYPTGAGLPGAFYIHYHSYRYIWPLMSLSNYKNKYL
ncbi:squalene--hopene cyclase [Salipaludibacillus aurantiacus]|uniref:Sporulenol synthase n=1 Tax=Salipaludibacillus aurantiacus TaxID=1601833 RepID=A0A1H9W537_9BACI|nr:squalene--hopene cyclase [Salipaludibacillus aurantiacus]SES28787.1 sporulenol synthase [Salipaludibacillus aurantiacus]